MSEARHAVTEALKDLDKEWRDRALISFARVLLETLKKAGWTLVKITDKEE